jgi:hypothetical protein
VNRLKIENIVSFSMSPVSKCIAVYVSGKKVMKNTRNKNVREFLNIFLELERTSHLLFACINIQI